MEMTESEFNKRIGQAIKSIRITTPYGKFRKTRYMTQTKLSQIIGVTFQQVQKYEKGMNGCSSYRLFQIGNALKVSVDYILSLALGKQYDVSYTFKDDRFVKIAELKLNENDEIIIMEKPLILTNEVKEQKQQN